jgi:hypothetical protein
MPKTIVLGDEHDDALRDALRATLHELGAVSLDQSWGLAGSQELSTHRVSLGSEIVTIESETYIGLSITGGEDTVDRIAAGVAQRRPRPA